MEEFQEADILWPAAEGSVDNVDGRREAPPMTACSAAGRSKAAAPVDISSRKRRCRPWPAPPECCYAVNTTLGQEIDTDVSDEEGRRRTDDDAKGTTTTTSSDDALAIVPPHVLVARRRLVMGGRTAAYSMCAGKGRTLKGRDLRDVRNLVLKMTGFIEK